MTIKKGSNYQLKALLSGTFIYLIPLSLICLEWSLQRVNTVCVSSITENFNFKQKAYIIATVWCLSEV